MRFYVNWSTEQLSANANEPRVHLWTAEIVRDMWLLKNSF